MKVGDTDDGVYILLSDAVLPASDHGQLVALCARRMALVIRAHKGCCAVQMGIMGGFNDALQGLSDEKEQLRGQHKEAAHAHARARKQLASIESTMREYEAVAQGQQQAIDEAQDMLAANSQVRAVVLLGSRAHLSGVLPCERPGGPDLGGQAVLVCGTGLACDRVLHQCAAQTDWAGLLLT